MNEAQAEGAQNFIDEGVHTALEKERNRIIGKIVELEGSYRDEEIDFNKFVYLLTQAIEEGGD